LDVLQLINSPNLYWQGCPFRSFNAFGIEGPLWPVDKIGSWSGEEKGCSWQCDKNRLSRRVRGSGSGVTTRSL